MQFVGTRRATSDRPAVRPARPRWTLTALNLATYMLLLDITIVQVALPSIQRQFGGGLAGLQWTVDAYTLPLCGLVIALGTIADRSGRRRIFVGGVAVFTAASLLCALSPNLLVLNVARAVQGVGGAAMFATTLALIGQEFSGAARMRAIATWGSVVGAGVASGPLVGGLLMQAGEWRWIFYVNVPIGVAVTALTLRFIRDGRNLSARALDVPGVLTLAGGLTLVTAGLLRGSAADWRGHGAVIAILAGAVLLLAFAVFQRRTAAMIDKALFRNPAFAAVSAATLALGAGMFAMFIFITVYLQNVLGYSPLQGGLRMLPVTAPVFVVPLLMHRFGVPVVSGRVIGVGLVLAAAGLIAMLAAGATTSWVRLAAGMLVAGVGVGLANPAIAATGLAVVPGARNGLAAGVSNTCRLAGLTLGIAVLGTLFRAQIGVGLGPAAGSVRSLVAAGELRHAAELLATPGATALTQHAFTGALHLVFLLGAAVTLLGGITSLVLVRRLPVARPAAESAAPPVLAAATP